MAIKRPSNTLSRPAQRAASGKKLVRKAANPMALEQRFMFDGAALASTDPQPLDAARTAPALADKAVEAPRTHTERAATTREIVFIDSTVPELNSLLAGVREGVEVVVIQPGQDGVETISRTLANGGAVGAVHIVSHASSGAMVLGESRLAQTTQAQWQPLLEG